MSQPHSSALPLPDFFGQYKTVFYFEGHASAILVETLNGRRRKATLPLGSAEAALAWCKGNVAAPVYSPARPETN